MCKISSNFATHFIPTILILFSLCSTYQVVVVVATGSPLPSSLPRSTLSLSLSPQPRSASSSSLDGSNVEEAKKVIQQFFKGITSDNCGFSKFTITDTPDLCKNPKFGCTPVPSKDSSKQTKNLYAIDFNECGIMGKNITIDGFIDKLPDVSIFHVNSNSFGGNIPVLSHLPYLSELDLSNNKYTGNFPMNILGATNLNFLDLRFNSFTGPVPPGLFNLKLLTLFINNNNFDHDLPSNMGSTLASFINLANNKFTGPIPKSIGQASNTLLEILFLNNTFSGCLPYEIGLLKNARVFDVSMNSLSGPIPESFGCLESIEYLVLEKNEFYGSVPEEVCTLRNLTKLNLADNYFTEVGPECRKLIQKGVLDIKHNCVMGLPNQRDPKLCAGFLSKPKPPKGCGEVNHSVTCNKGSKSVYLHSETEGGPQPHPTLTYKSLSL
ncbi:uncharacterized protein At4g06744-like [Spinacia oleracea]|uniref:Uncharacterized protein At4g06744-like n=1 Tax=Spinacia oleracea TaxID=3562 RepID=A0A9R0HZ08_SPIOL|nr:uncharacterized protein At4g06744-like [Spinacia oleracea]